MQGPHFSGNMIPRQEKDAYLLLSNNLEELINEPAHFRENGTQSCIDLVCTRQSYLFTDIGVLSSLDSHSKHNIIYGTLNFHIPPPPPHFKY